MLSKWWLVASRAHEGSIVKPMLLNISIDSLDDESDYILSKSKGDTNKTEGLTC